MPFNLYQELAFQLSWTFLLFLYHRIINHKAKVRNRIRDIRIERLERQLMPIHLTQVPADPHQWGLSSLIPGVPGRLGMKVDKLIIHWADTTLAGADNVFTGKTGRKVSAHFCVEEEQVHQYLSLKNVGWHAGNWLANLTSVGIEHSAAPDRPASEVTYNTSAELICDICAQLGLVPSRSLLHKHSEFSATSCPGTIDLDHLAELAVSKWHDLNTPQVTLASAPVKSGPVEIQSDMTNMSPTVVKNPETSNVTIQPSFSIATTVNGARFRDQPSLNGKVMAEYPEGTQVLCKAIVTGDTVNGTNQWYQSLVHGWYISTSISKKL